MALKEYRYQQATYLFEDGEAPDGAVLVETPDAAVEAPAPAKARTPSNKARTAKNKSTDGDVAGDAGDTPTE